MTIRTLNKRKKRKLPIWTKQDLQVVKKKASRIYAFFNLVRREK